MKKALLISLTFCFSVISQLSAQKSFMKFGKIPEQDIEMTVYPNDTSAAAVVLGDFGFTRFAISEDEGFYLNFTRHIRIKILKKTALSWADFRIVLYVGQGGDDEEVNMLKGFTFNMENGKLSKYKLDRG
jgi:hypothetical protein